MAVLLTGALLLTGCGGQGQNPPASSSTTSTSSPSASATPTATSAPTTTASPTTDPNIPTAARAHTPAGAAAFVRYFHDQLNIAWGEPRAGLLAPLSLPSCKTCRTLEDTSADLVKDLQHMDGDTIRIDSVDPSSMEPNGDQSVIVTGAQLHTAIVDSDGKKVRDIPADRIRFFVTTRWTPSGWRLAEIQVLK